MNVFIKTAMESLPETCDDCWWYGCRPHPDKGWSEECEIMMHCMDDDQPKEWVYDGNKRPDECPLVGIEKRTEGDYVSRKYLLDEYDRQHEGPPGGARKIIAEAPAENVLCWEKDENNTLTVTVPKGTDVQRVLVQEKGSHFGSMFYAD